jgi:CheY-like chemotaxis protein
MSQERILIIDSDIKSATLLKTKIEALGYLVDHVRTSDEAMFFLRIRWFDLIIVDSKIKGKSQGLGLLREIKRKKTLANVAVIVQSDKVYLRKTFELMGITSFFMKPYAVEVLLEEIKDVLTPKILLYGEKGSVYHAIDKDLLRLELKTDFIQKLSAFYYQVITYRYKIIIVEYNTRPNITDRMLMVVRSSFKNRETPVIVYVAKKKVKFNQAENAKLQSLKDRCLMIGRCEVMDSEFVMKDFTRHVNRYLDIES